MWVVVGLTDKVQYYEFEKDTVDRDIAFLVLRRKGTENGSAAGG